MADIRIGHPARLRDEEGWGVRLDGVDPTSAWADRERLLDRIADEKKAPLEVGVITRNYQAWKAQVLDVVYHVYDAEKGCYVILLRTQRMKGNWKAADFGVQPEMPLELVREPTSEEPLWETEDFDEIPF